MPALRSGLDREENFGAECYLVDSEEYLDDRSMMYVPVVNTKKITLVRATRRETLSTADFTKRHDILLNAVRGSELTGHSILSIGQSWIYQ